MGGDVNDDIQDIRCRLCGMTGDFHDFPPDRRCPVGGGTFTPRVGFLERLRRWLGELGR